MGLRRLTLVVAVVASLAATCTPSRDGMTRERAITIARSRLTFLPDQIDAQRVTASGVDVWRVSFRGRLPDQPPLLFEALIVDVDAHSGNIVSIARP